jgi:phage-related protein
MRIHINRLSPMASFPAEGKRELHWIGSSKDELRSFPAQVRRDIGSALEAALLGGKAVRAKPWKGAGSGVFEVAEAYNGNAYRAVYAVRFEKAVYVLHAFQKKSTRGIRTGARDVEAVNKALKTAKAEYEQKYGRGS